MADFNKPPAAATPIAAPIRSKLDELIANPIFDNDARAILFNNGISTDEGAALWTSEELLKAGLNPTQVKFYLTLFPGKDKPDSNDLRTVVTGLLGVPREVLSVLPSQEDRPYCEDEDRKDIVKSISKLMEQNISALPSQNKVKEVWTHALIHGISGQGKTRFCMEIVDALRRHALCSADLSARLKVTRTVVVSFLNGQLLHAGENSWTASVMLGARILHTLYLRQKFSWSTLVTEINSKSLHNCFELDRVVDFVLESSRLTLLHVVIDELQQTQDEFRLYAGNSETGHKKESLSLAIHRCACSVATRGASRDSYNLLITYACTAISPERISGPTSEFSRPLCYALPPLAPSSVTEMVTTTPEMQPNMMPLAKPVLPLLGGNPRAVSFFCHHLKSEQTLLAAWDATVTAVASKWKADQILPSVLFPLVAVSGLPVPSTLEDRTDDDDVCVRVSDLPLMGIAEVSACADSARVTVSMPPVLLWAALPKSCDTAVKSIISEYIGIPLMQTPADFERLTTRVLALRYYAAEIVAKRTRCAHIEASDLFYGMRTSSDFAGLKFSVQPLTVVLGATGVAWRDPAAHDLEFPCDPKQGPTWRIVTPCAYFAPLGGEHCWIDSILRMFTVNGEDVFIWADSKQGDSANWTKNSGHEPKTLKQNVLALMKKLPGVHALCMIVTQNSPQLEPYLAGKSSKDKTPCPYLLVMKQSLKAGLSEPIASLISTSSELKHASPALPREEKRKEPVGVSDDDEDFERPASAKRVAVACVCCKETRRDSVVCPRCGASLCKSPVCSRYHKCE